MSRSTSPIEWNLCSRTLFNTQERSADTIQLLLIIMDFFLFLPAAVGLTYVGTVIDLEYEHCTSVHTLLQHTHLDINKLDTLSFYNKPQFSARCAYSFVKRIAFVIFALGPSNLENSVDFSPFVTFQGKI